MKYKKSDLERAKETDLVWKVDYSKWNTVSVNELFKLSI